MATAARRGRTINNNVDGQLVHTAAGRGNSYWRQVFISPWFLPEAPGNTICGGRLARERTRGSRWFGGWGGDPGYEIMIKYVIKRAPDEWRRDCDSQQARAAWRTLPLSQGGITNPPLIPFPVAGQREVAPHACRGASTECKV